SALPQKTQHSTRSAGDQKPGLRNPRHIRTDPPLPGLTAIPAHKPIPGLTLYERCRDAAAPNDATEPPPQPSGRRNRLPPDPRFSSFLRADDPSLPGSGAPARGSYRPGDGRIFQTQTTPDFPDGDLHFDGAYPA